MPDFTKGSSLTWGGNAVGSLFNIGAPEITVGTKETTAHDSSGRWREFIAGLVDGGSVAVQGYYKSTDTTGQIAMRADAAAGTIRQVVITGPSSIFSITFNAIITNLKPIGDAPIEDAFAFAATLKVTGAVAWAETASAGMSALAVSNSAVAQPVFAIGTFDYVYTVLTGVSSVTVTPTAASHTITVEANGLTQNVVSGQASSSIALGSAGSVTIVKITVQESGKVAKAYTLRITRA